jgi:integration host factor subunit beta
VIKSELVRALNEKLPELQVKDVELALNCILRQLADAIVQGERIEIRLYVK